MVCNVQEHTAERSDCDSSSHSSVCRDEHSLLDGYDKRRDSLRPGSRGGNVFVLSLFFHESSYSFLTEYHVCSARLVFLFQTFVARVFGQLNILTSIVVALTTLGSALSMVYFASR